MKDKSDEPVVKFRCLVQLNTADPAPIVALIERCASEMNHDQRMYFADHGGLTSDWRNVAEGEEDVDEVWITVCEGLMAAKECRLEDTSYTMVFLILALITAWTRTVSREVLLRDNGIAKMTSMFWIVKEYLETRTTPTGSDADTTRQLLIHLLRVTVPDPIKHGCRDVLLDLWYSYVESPAHLCHGMWMVYYFGAKEIARYLQALKVAIVGTWEEDDGGPSWRALRDQLVIGLKKRGPGSAKKIEAELDEAYESRAIDSCLYTILSYTSCPNIRIFHIRDKPANILIYDHAGVHIIDMTESPNYDTSTVCARVDLHHIDVVKEMYGEDSGKTCVVFRWRGRGGIERRKEIALDDSFEDVQLALDKQWPEIVSCRVPILVRPRLDVYVPGPRTESTIVAALQAMGMFDDA